jgi:hypothetical protein
MLVVEEEGHKRFKLTTGFASSRCGLYRLSIQCALPSNALPVMCMLCRLPQNWPLEAAGCCGSGTDALAAQAA